MKSTALEFILSLSLMLICGQAFSSPSQDPFESIEHFELPNGMHVYLAPSADAKLFGYRLDVQVGTNEEVAPNFGVSHLLEHVLFRNRSLKNEMSYLQLIEEAGGDANGETNIHRTSFYAKVPAKKAEWLMDTLATMILDPQITAENVAKERGTVELERGRPNPIAEVLGFDIMTYLNPSYLNMPPFWKSEFGISDDQPFTLTEEQLSTQRLTALQAQNHYQNYYHPSNMVLFVAGKFDQQKILEQIYARWGQIPSRSGLPPRIFKIPKIKKGPYVLKSVTDGTPEAKLGTKLWKVTAEEYEVANSYVEFLAHRLMKEIRNVSGETYTARGYTSTDHGFGFSFVSFDTTASHFYENVKKAQKYITEEAATGQMKDDQVYEALKLQTSYYDLQGHEAPDLLRRAQQLDFIRRHYGESISPYKVLSTITPERYNEILKKVFTPDQEYIATTAPPLLFRYDLNILEFLFAITTLFFLRIFFFLQYCLVLNIYLASLAPLRD